MRFFPWCEAATIMMSLSLFLQVKSLLGYRIVHVACGSRDAQTLALSDEGLVFSWGDGDFGKLGRGGSEGCNTPHNIERLNGMGVCQIECGAQFSLALTKYGQVSRYV
jgi:E3 ubiquitin-protein ligase HERC2